MKGFYWIGASWPHMRKNGCSSVGVSTINYGDGSTSPMFHIGRLVIWTGELKGLQ
jgi:hypothetical protein